MILSKLDAMELMLSTGTHKDREDYTTDMKLYPKAELYSRLIHIPAGDIILGESHKVWGLNILASGSMSIADDGLKAVRIDAPKIFESGPGSRKLALALTDCVFINIAKLEDGDTIGNIEDRVINKSIIKEITWDG